MSKGLPRSLSRGEPTRQEIYKVAIPLKDVVVNVAATGAAAGFGSVVIGGLPEGNLCFLGAVADLEFKGPAGGSVNLVDTWSGDYGIGTQPTADATLSGGEIDMVISTAVGPAVAEASPVAHGTSTPAECGRVLNNTGENLELNLNVLVDAADITDDTNVDLTVNGILYCAMTVLGDD